MAKPSRRPTLGVGNEANWQLNVINVADGQVRPLVSARRESHRTGSLDAGRQLPDRAGRGSYVRPRPTAKHRLSQGRTASLYQRSLGLHARIWMLLMMARPWPPFSAPAPPISGLRRQRIHLRPARLTSGEPAYNAVAPGPSGKVLATSSERRCVVDECGRQPGGGAGPARHNVSSISSCGDRYVMYDSYRDGKIELWRVDADGSNGQKLADEHGRFRLFARWQVGLLRQQGQDLPHAGRRW